MTNLQLLAEVRRFFPHARRVCRDRWGFLALRSGRCWIWVSDLLDYPDWGVVVNAKGGKSRASTGSTPAKALRALGFAERVPAWRKPMWLQLKMLRNGRNACPLQSTQRPRKGARLGARKRREASHANHP